MCFLICLFYFSPFSIHWAWLAETVLQSFRFRLVVHILDLLHCSGNKSRPINLRNVPLFLTTVISGKNKGRQKDHRPSCSWWKGQEGGICVVQSWSCELSERWSYLLPCHLAKSTTFCSEDNYVSLVCKRTRLSLISSGKMCGIKL